jgi:hypothetical protein
LFFFFFQKEKKWGGTCAGVVVGNSAQHQTNTSRERAFGGERGGAVFCGLPRKKGLQRFFLFFF